MLGESLSEWKKRMDMFILDLSLSDSLSSSLQWVCSKRKNSVDKKKIKFVFVFALAFASVGSALILELKPFISI